MTMTDRILEVSTRTCHVPFCCTASSSHTITTQGFIKEPARTSTLYIPQRMTDGGASVQLHCVVSVVGDSTAQMLLEPVAGTSGALGRTPGNPWRAFRLADDDLRHSVSWMAIALGQIVSAEALFGGIVVD
jgi:hypothetical protein